VEHKHPLVGITFKN